MRLGSMAIGDSLQLRPQGFAERGDGGALAEGRPHILRVDALQADGRNPRLVIVVPERDDHPYLRPLAEALREPAEVVTVTDDWRAP